MGKIIIILIIVGIVGYIICRIAGNDPGESATGGCLSSMGCGVAILEIVVSVGVIVLFIYFVIWLFD